MISLCFTFSPTTRIMYSTYWRCSGGYKKRPKKNCLYNIICKCPCTLEVDEEHCFRKVWDAEEKLLLLQFRSTHENAALVNPALVKTKFITVRHENNDTLAAYGET